jgi:metal-sulfur cluster biosynthetic enzyme
MLAEQQVYDVLRTIDDPELGLSLVDLGLIYGIDVQGGTIHIHMTMTTEGCPMHDAIVPAVEAAVAALPSVERVEVELVWDPPWTPDRISPLAAAALGW